MSHNYDFLSTPYVHGYGDSSEYKPVQSRSHARSPQNAKQREIQPINETARLKVVNEKLTAETENINKQLIDANAKAAHYKQNNELLESDNKMLHGIIAELKQAATAEQQHFETESAKHEAEHATSQQEIDRLEKARRKKQSKVGKLTNTLNQVRAENDANLAQLAQIRQEKTILEAHVFQMYSSFRLQRSVEELSDKLTASQNGVACSRQTCIDAQNQLCATHDKLVATQQQLEIVVESNNELQHRIDANQMVSDMQRVNVQSLSVPKVISNSDNQTISGSQLTLAEAYHKCRAIALALDDDDYVDCLSPQPRRSNTEALRN